VHAVRYRLDPPIKINRGDEIRTTCTYSSTGRTEATHFGESTSDEMCFALMAVYPKAALPKTETCVAIGNDTLCPVSVGRNGHYPSVKLSEQ
jgi:dopamine beta-monooxygenase